MARHRSHAAKNQTAVHNAGSHPLQQKIFPPQVVPFHTGLPKMPVAPFIAWPSFLFEKILNPWRDLRPALSWMDSWRPAGRHAFPKVDSMETDEAYLYRIELPDISRDQIALSVKKGVIMLQVGESQALQEKQRYYRRTRFLRRAFSLPVYTDAAAITAELKNGVLTIVIPKSDKPTPAISHFITIKERGAAHGGRS